MSANILSRGDYWFSLLTKDAQIKEGQCHSVKVADGNIEGKRCRFIAVLPDSKKKNPRSRHGEVVKLEWCT